MSARHLRPITRVTWAFLVLALGLGSSALLFFWVERNMAMPGALYRWFGWPWLALWDQPLMVRVLIDFGLFLAFGFFHSVLAQIPVQTFLKRVFPFQCIRAFYLIFTGVSALLLMGCWQNTGIIIWTVAGLSFRTLNLLSIIIYYYLLFLALRVIRAHDVLEFLGLRQLYLKTELRKNTTLMTSGYYNLCRHPIYLFTLAAFSIAPMMSLDRLLFIAGNFLYLSFAIPIEEKKLEAQFGQPYRDYQARIPRLIPRWRTRFDAHNPKS